MTTDHATFFDLVDQARSLQIQAQQHGDGFDAGSLWRQCYNHGLTDKPLPSDWVDDGSMNWRLPAVVKDVMLHGIDAAEA